MERTLASIQRVIALTPIEGADRIELATINGWQCVVKKGDFKVGDLGVYIEIDSVPPDTEEFSFLWNKNDVIRARPNNFRIRTIRLRGQLSQGLFMPISSFAGLLEAFLQSTVACVEDVDVTEILGITKYEPVLPANGNGDQEGAFPGCIPKTDEMRIQSKPKLIQELAEAGEYVATLKLDGTSCTFGFNPRNDEFFVASRNWQIREGDNKYWDVAREWKELLTDMKLIVQGEIVGPGIQGNKLGLRKVEFFVFNIFDPMTGEYIDHDKAVLFCESCGFHHVPVIERGLMDAETTVADLLQRAEGVYPGTTNQREGLVFRPVQPTASRLLQGRLSFKAISNTFLLGEKD